MKSIKFKILSVAALLLTSVVGTTAADNTTSNPVLGVLSTVTTAELPAKAADLVTQAASKDAKQMTIDVVKAAVGLNPAAAPAIVGSIAQTKPQMAATACATAVALVPDQVLVIARAAAAACPTNAGAIVEAICVVLPADYQEVAEAVAEVVPGAGKEILAGISTAIPQLKNEIDQALAGYQGSVPSVSTILSHVAQTESLAAGAEPLALPQGAAPGAPIVPPSGTPLLNPPSGGGTIPSRGGHGYSAP